MRIRLPRRVRPLTAKLVTARTLAARPYALYRGETACDTASWGRPRGRFSALALAMRAAGHPDWQTDEWYPGEAFTGGDSGWTILGPGADRETELLKASAALDPA